MAHNAPKHLASMAALILALALVAACDSSNPASPGSTAAVNTGSGTAPGTGTSGSGGTGTLRVMLKDSPFSEASAVLVGFSEVSVHRSAGAGTDTGQWTTISTGASPITCDLMKLRDGAEPQPLAVGTIAAGHYTQIRLTIATIPLPAAAEPMSVALYQGRDQSSSPACVVGNATALAPTGQTTTGPFPVRVPSGEIKLNHQFDVQGGTTLTITLDFDGDKSIHKTGNGTYMMSPVVGIADVRVQ